MTSPLTEPIGTLQEKYLRISILHLSSSYPQLIQVI